MVCRTRAIVNNSAFLNYYFAWAPLPLVPLVAIFIVYTGELA